jgi:hypothetical protein
MAPVSTIIGGEGDKECVIETLWIVSATLFDIRSSLSSKCHPSHPRVRGLYTNVAPPILFSSVAMSLCPGALLLQEALLWTRFVVIPRVQQYVLAGGVPVLGVMAERLLKDVTEGLMLACSARATASSQAASAACVVASVVVMLAVPW